MLKSRFSPANFSVAIVIRGGCGLFFRRNTRSRHGATRLARNSGTDPIGRGSPKPSAIASKNRRLVTNSPSVTLNTSPTAFGLSAARKMASTRLPT